jgi:hypothetical protein
MEWLDGIDLEERALRIDSEDLRTSFTSAVPENARIVRLAQEWHAHG